MRASASPEAVALDLEAIAQSHDPCAELSRHPPGIAALVAVLGASPALGRLLRSTPAALQVLEDLDSRPIKADDSASELQRWKQLEMLRIAARDLLGLDRLEDVTHALSQLASDVVASVLSANGLDDHAVIGMGKLGADELNYASDIDLLIVSEGEPANAAGLRAALETLRKCFRVDLSLRPEGRSGPLVRSLDSYRAYWERWAEPWEFQALIKARPIAGASEIGLAFADSATEALWNRSWGADELRSLRELKARTEAILARDRLNERELKRGPGGIRDIEFAVQILQLVHGRNDPALRSKDTLSALQEMSAAGYVSPSDAWAMAEDYRFLRSVEHHLQLEELAQSHVLPVEADRRARLARSLGYPDDSLLTATQRFESELRLHRSRTREIHERLYFRPLLDAFGTLERTHPEAVPERLRAFGFVDAERTRSALYDLSRGLTRSSRLMGQMLTLLLSWLADSPDPEGGLLGLRRMASSTHRRDLLVDSFRESPEAARRLCLLLGSGSYPTEALLREPDVVTLLDDERALAPRPEAQLETEAVKLASGRPHTADAARALVHWKRRQTLMTAAADIVSSYEVEDVGTRLTDIAEATLAGLLHCVGPRPPIAAIAMGRFGGREMSYASDVDLLLVCEDSDDAEAAEHAAIKLLRIARGDTPAGEVLPVDLSIRPEGRQGPLVRSLQSYRSYFGRWAQTWERQAMLRARPVAGDPAIGQAFCEDLGDVLWSTPFSASDVRDMRRMKARMERERIPPGEDPEFHLKLGRGSLSDVEWTVQLLQLRYGVPGQSTMGALAALQSCGALPKADADALRASYRFCELTRNRWFLVNGRPGDSLPTKPEQLGVLARSLGRKPNSLREEYRRVTRRARRVMEENFYRDVPREVGSAAAETS